MLRILFTISISVLLSGCFAGTYFALGGSRADGVVEFACNYDILTTCNVKPPPETNLEAIRMCKNWGYERAQTFGSYRNQKTSFDGSTGQLTVSYQCIGETED